MPNNYTCFFVSRIGDERSSEREQSDQVLFEIIVPALIECGFIRDRIFRADMDMRPGKITEQMEGHLEGGQLCIADVSGLNPNVMYEIGYRKALRKPLVILSDTETIEKLPFDINDLRAIEYDLNNWHKRLQAKDDLKDFVHKLIESGQMDSNIKRIEDEIKLKFDDIEKKINILISNAKIIGGDVNKTMPEINKTIPELKIDLEYYIKIGHRANAENIFSIIESTLSDEEKLAYNISLTQLGSLKAAMKIKEHWNEIKEQYSNNIVFIYNVLASYIVCCNENNLELSEMDFLEKECNYILILSQDDEFKSLVWNQLNKLYYGAAITLSNGNDDKERMLIYADKAIVAIKNAININPNNPTYYSNFALILRLENKLDEASEMISKCCFDLNTDDFDHLVLAYQIFQQTNEKEKCQEIDNKLQQIDYQKWTRMKIKGLD